MNVNIIQIFLILIFTMLAWWVAHKFTLPDIILRIVEIVIVVVAVLALVSAFGLGSGLHLTV